MDLRHPRQGSEAAPALPGSLPGLRWLPREAQAGPPDHAQSVLGPVQLALGDHRRSPGRIRAAALRPRAGPRDLRGRLLPPLARWPSLLDPHQYLARSPPVLVQIVVKTRLSRRVFDLY